MTNTSKIKKVLQFYLLATKLKDMIRGGRIWWNVDRERVESIAEHIYGTCILAIAIDSEFDFSIDLEKVILMLVIHELEEIFIGDLTPFDQVSKEEKREKGKKAVEKVLEGLEKKEFYVSLTDEFNAWVSNESQFAQMCDKLQANIQCKLYTEEGVLDMYHPNNIHLLEDERVKKLMDQGENTVADLFIEYTRKNFDDEIFLELWDFVKENTLQTMK